MTHTLTRGSCSQVPPHSSTGGPIAVGLGSTDEPALLANTDPAAKILLDSEVMMHETKHLTKFSTLGDLAPEAFNAFVAFEHGAIPLKYKELIAVAVALTTQCAYCIDVHSKKAKFAGATDQELAETTLLAAALRAGGAITRGTHTMK